MASHASSTKGQRSISSFFTPKNVNPAAEAQKDSPKADIHNTEIEKRNCRTSASYPSGSKRPLAEDPGAINGGRDPIAKRQKGSSTRGNSLEESSYIDQSQSTPKALLQRSKTSSRTEKFVYQRSSQSISHVEPVDEEANEETRRRRELLHQKFIKKLGHPDSIAQIKRRNWQIAEETEALDEEDAENGDEEEEVPATARFRKKGAKTGKLTPMELQMLDIKRKHMDAILFVEVGYKFKFFGEDARIAAKELGIVCIPGKFRYDEHPSEAHLDKFASASIPNFRLPVHAKRLVQAGHKVGVVRQIETAALKKAGDNRNTPFIRKLTNLYTKGTYIDDIEGLDNTGPSGGAPASGYLLCITESRSKGSGTDEKVEVGILAVQPATGDVIYDNFEDGFMRSEIETRLLHISPCEFLVVGDMTKASEKLLQHMSESSQTVHGDKIRIERIEKSKSMAVQSFSHVSRFYADKLKDNEPASNDKTAGLLEKVLNLPEHVTVCLSAMITHLSEYGLEHVLDLTKYFQSFSARSHMLLNGNTLTSLEIYHNQSDYTEKGSLFWALDKTKTKFGQRLLRKWVGRPLIDKERLEERIYAVEELMEGNQSVKVDKLKSLLMKVKSDLERSLLRIYYGKCTRPELLNVLQTMQRIADEFALVKSPQDAGFKSPALNEAVATLPLIGDMVVSQLEKINPEAARADDKYAFFRENEETEAIEDHKLGIAAVEEDLNAHRKVAAEKIKKNNVTYVTVAGIEYLIEVANTDLKHVPASWAKISGTKKVSRFHTPEVIRMIRERDQHKEALAAACDEAFTNLLADISSHYQSFRDCVFSLATLDCLLSLATVAAQPGYVKPEYVSDPEITIVGGRHPMVEQLLLDAYVPNDTCLSNNSSGQIGTRALLITGPNMGGKSSYVRHVALISIMAQIGSYVPADSARLGLLDAVFTRMGAADNMMAGESTFMVELSETSDILKQATPRSLVILDELGRGTSTHDGVAIAQAVLEHVVREVKCLTLFITHYQTLAAVGGGFPDGELKNVHMQFVESSSSLSRRESGETDTETDVDMGDITFLYQVGEGIAHRSYGLNVARLAKVPAGVLQRAAVKSREMEENAREKKLGALGKILADILSESGKGKNEDGTGDQLEQLVVGIEQL